MKSDPDAKARVRATVQAERELQLAASLRANLRRRKGQQRARMQPETEALLPSDQKPGRESNRGDSDHQTSSD